MKKIVDFILGAVFKFLKLLGIRTVNMPKTDELTFEYVSDEPEFILSNKIYIIKEGNQPDSLLFLCPCDCGNKIYLNLLPDANPRWAISFSNSKITVMPSINRTVGCGSHFFIISGKVRWV